MLAISIAVLTALVGCGYPVAAKPACADAVLDDWTNGSLRSTYPPDCYYAAIDALPEDLRAYTTAEEDISRAASAASRAHASERRLASARPVEGNGLRAFPVQVIGLAAVVTGIVAVGVAASLIRRRGTR